MTTCKRCIMSDVGDPKIKFDDKGYCNYCSEALSEINTTKYFPNEYGRKKLDTIINQIKNEGKGKKYDCAMGISGGLDSAYLAYLGYKWGLRIFAVHIDDGFDTEVSKTNINKLIKATEIDYKVIRPDEKQYYALIKAYMKASVPNIAVPQDNVLFAFLYDEIKKNDIKYFLSGDNFALEGILQKGNTHPYTDVVNIRDIAKKCDTEAIDKLKLISTYQKAVYKYIFNVKTIKPLNYIEYRRDDAFGELYDFCGFEYYGRKHLENILTAFVQLYWLPKKFGVDKRTSHLSSMIASNQMTREEAIKEYNEPLYDKTMMDRYIYIIKEKLGIDNDEFDLIMKKPGVQHTEYRYEIIEPLIRKVLNK